MKLYNCLVMALLVACAPSTDNIAEPEEPDASSSKGPIFHEGEEGFDLPTSFKNIKINEPSVYFYFPSPRWKEDFEGKSDYETLDEYRQRFVDALTDLGAENDGITATYLSLGQVWLGPRDILRSTGAVKITYSLESENALFQYNPGDLVNEIKSAVRETQMGRTAQRYQTYTHVTVRDIDCAATQAVGESMVDELKFGKAEYVKMDRATAERYDVLGSPRLLAVARLEYDLSDPRYLSASIIDRLVDENFRHQVYSKSKIFIIGTPGPTETWSSNINFYSSRTIETDYYIYFSNITDILIIDQETMNVVYRLPACPDL